MNNELPGPLMEIYTRNSRTHDYNTRGKNNPRSMSVKSSFVQKSFLGLGPKLWGEFIGTKKMDFTSVKSFIYHYKKLQLEKY